MAHRPSKYLFCGAEDAHLYPSGNVFHFNPRAESVWTEEERTALLQHIAATATRTSTANGKWEQAQDTVRTHSAMVCYMQYMNVDSPSINNAEWTPDEDNRLLDLVGKYSEHEWSHVAEELGTNRTPIACLRHYQQTLNMKLLDNSEWSSEEDLLLKQAVDTCGKGKWQKVSTFVPGRSSTQCMNRWVQSNLCQENAVAGKWLEQEERLLFLAAVAYNAPRMQQFKKTDAQLRELYVLAGLESRSSVGGSGSDAGRGSGSSGSDAGRGTGGNGRVDGGVSPDSVDERAPAATNTAIDHTSTANTTAGPVPATGASFAYWKEMAALVPGK